MKLTIVIRSLLIFLFVPGISTICAAQNRAADIEWKCSFIQLSNSVARITIHAKLPVELVMLSGKQHDERLPKTVISFAPSQEYTLIGRIKASGPEVSHMLIAHCRINYFRRTVTFSQQIRYKDIRSARASGTIICVLYDVRNKNLIKTKFHFSSTPEGYAVRY